MRICLDARVTTRGGTSTFIDGFVQQIGATTHQHEIDIVAHQEQGYDLTSSSAVPTGRVREMLWAQLSLPGMIRRGEYDVYHSLKHIGPLACPARTVYRVPAVGQFNGTYPLSRSNQFYWGTLGGHAYRNADLLIAVSDYIRGGLIELLGLPEERVVTVHNGVDRRYTQRPASPEDLELLAEHSIDGPFFLCVGNLGPVKNFSTAIRAFQNLCERGNRDALLVLAGGKDSAHGEALQTLAASTPARDRIRFIGFQPPDRLTGLYNRATALVHPSFHEGFSLTLLEAMACGLPMVTSTLTSIPEAAGDAALYVERATDHESFADRLTELLHNSTLRSDLAGNALRRAPQFSWEACASKTLAAYDRVAA